VLTLSALKLLNVSNGWLLFVAIASAVLTLAYLALRKPAVRQLATASAP
jgi:hypothetical protein